MKINNENLLIVDGAPVAANMASNINMKPFYLGHICNFSVQLVFTGAPVGQFKLQLSNDPGQPSAAGDSQKYVGVDNWTDIAGSQQAISAAGNHAYQFENAGFTWCRVVYTATSGSGTITVARVNEKGV